MKRAPARANWAHCDSGSHDAEPCSRPVGGLVTRRAASVVALMSAGVMILAGCTSSGKSDPSSSPTRPASSTSSSTSSSPSISTSSSSAVPTSSSAVGPDPRSKAAVVAYQRFVAAGNTAERTPSKIASSKALASFAIDPALGSEQSDITNFQLENIEWRGTPPSTRVRVTKTDFAAKPYAAVTVVDCPTLSSTWRPFNAQTGKPLKLVRPKVNPPWATTATVVLYKGKWMVQTEKTDMRRTCTP